MKVCGKQLPKEPFKKLITQGMVCHETFSTKDNKWIEPKNVIKEKGAYLTNKGGKTIEVLKGRSEKMAQAVEKAKNLLDPWKS